MEVRRIRVAVLKIFVCAAVGAMAGIIFAACYNLFVDNWADEAHVTGFWIGVAFGLFVGISWAIKRKEVRTVFVVPSLVGLLISATGVLIRVSQNFEDDEAGIVMMLALPVGLCIGTVWALSRAGAFSQE